MANGYYSSMVSTCMTGDTAYNIDMYVHLKEEDCGIVKYITLPN